MACPACSSTKSLDSSKTGLPSGVSRCGSCGAEYTTRPIYRGDSYTVASPHWHEGEDGETFYFDLDVIGSQGPERRHGWANKTTRRIVQTG